MNILLLRFGLITYKSINSFFSNFGLWRGINMEEVPWSLNSFSSILNASPFKCFAVVIRKRPLRQPPSHLAIGVT